MEGMTNMYNAPQMYQRPYNASTPMYNGYNMYQCPYITNTPVYNSNLWNQFPNQYFPYIEQPKPSNPIILKDYGPHPFVVNIEEATKQNNNFRTALWTGSHLQLTLMSINVGEDIGLENHPNLDQFIRIEEGQGLVKMGDQKLVDSMIKDGLWCAFNEYHMGVTAENLCERYSLTRDEQDEFAANSQQKAVAAIQSGRFEDEIVPVMIPQRKGDPVIFSVDEYPRAGTTKESLGKLRPAFKKDGTVTAGNASGINDGAAAVVVMSKEKAEELGLTPLVTIRGNASAGVDPSVMGIGPVKAVNKALKRASLTLDDMELIEANEAFAAQSISVDRELSFNKDILNVNGGAIALGHPIGASGARVLVTLIHEMTKREAKLGLATLCIGGGQGVATIVERV